jgi:hypothetical protein
MDRKFPMNCPQFGVCWRQEGDFGTLKIWGIEVFDVRSTFVTKRDPVNKNAICRPVGMHQNVVVAPNIVIDRSPHFLASKSIPRTRITLLASSKVSTNGNIVLMCFTDQR